MANQRASDLVFTDNLRWNSLNGIARDKRSEDWELLPEEQEFIDRRFPGAKLCNIQG